ncbi:HAD hydrolase family protein [Sodalis sp.]
MMTLGDQPNDLAMIEYAGTGVAMGIPSMKSKPLVNLSPGPI